MPKANPRTPEARDEYVTGGDDVTLETVSEKYSIPVRTLETHSAREKWVAERVNFRREVAETARKKLLETEAEVRVRQMRLGRLLQVKGYERVRDMKVKELEPEIALRYVRFGTEIERKALGIEDGRGNVLLNLNVTPEDLERMSDEELSALYAKLKTATD